MTLLLRAAEAQRSDALITDHVAVVLAADDTCADNSPPQGAMAPPRRSDTQNTISSQLLAEAYGQGIQQVVSLGADWATRAFNPTPPFNIRYYPIDPPGPGQANQELSAKTGGPSALPT